MTLIRFAASTVVALALATPALAQPVDVAPLAAPDLFSPAARDTGLPPDLWRDASPDIARTVMPLLGQKPLSPAGAALARRVLATGAAAPAGAGMDRGLASARAAGLTFQGDLAGGSLILSRTPGVERDAQLSQAAAEAALLSRDDDRACVIAQSLAEGRDQIYWMRLRAWCQARGGNANAARLTFDLAQAQAKDPVFARLMEAKLSPGGPPPAASLRNGLDYAQSRDLGLDLSPVKPSAALAGALAPPPAAAAVWTIAAGPGDLGAAWTALAAGDLARAEQIRAGMTADAAPAGGVIELALLDAALAAASGKGEEPALDRLVERGGTGEAKARARAQAAAVVLAGLGAPLSPAVRAQFAAFSAGDGKAAPARLMLLDQAAAAKRMGETALIALWIAADAGPSGPAPGDRAWIEGALKTAGLEADARAFAVEGLLALR